MPEKGSRALLRFGLELFRTATFFRTLILVDQLSFSEQGVPKRTEHFQQQVQLLQTLAPRAHRAQKEFELNATTTIGNRQHAMAPFVFATATRFDFGENVRRVTA